jgi:arylsulfatase A-like enzyme
MCGWSEYHTPNLRGGAETAEEVNVPLLRWLRQNARREEYFLHINYWDVHRCYRMDPRWADRFREHPVPQVWPDEEAIAAHQQITGAFTATGQFPDDESPYPLMPGAVRSRRDLEHLIDGYDAAIAYVDHHVQLVLDELDRQGVLDTAAILVSADHGDAFGEHGIYSDHVCADECIHRVPLIVRWPDLTPPDRTCDGLFYNVDLAATLCDLLGCDRPEAWDGISFRDQLAGDVGGGRDHLVWGHALYAVQRAVRTPRHLMVRTYDDDGYGFPSVQLYAIEDDPYQTVDLAADQPVVRDACVRVLDKWVQAQLARDGWPPDPMMEVLRERTRR